jgi:hypothetical protein
VGQIRQMAEVPETGTHVGVTKVERPQVHEVSQRRHTGITYLRLCHHEVLESRQALQQRKSSIAYGTTAEIQGQQVGHEVEGYHVAVAEQRASGEAKSLFSYSAARTMLGKEGGPPE